MKSTKATDIKTDIKNKQNMKDKNCIESVNKGDKVYFLKESSIEYGTVVEKHEETVFHRTRWICTIQYESHNCTHKCRNITEVYLNKADAKDALIESLSDVLRLYTVDLQHYTEKLSETRDNIGRINYLIEKLQNEE